MEKLEAIVDDIVFQSDDGMFSVLRMESKAQGRFTAVYHGNAPYMGENVAMEATGLSMPDSADNLIYRHCRFCSQLR